MSAELQVAGEAPGPRADRRAWSGWLTRALWPEAPEEREYRRGRLLITGPCGALVGLLFGALAVGRWGLPALPTVFAGALGGFLVVYLVGQVESLARSVARTRAGPWSLLIQIGADIVGGGILGRILATVLDADALASLAAGASILVVYSAVATRLFWGGWIEGTVRVLTGQSGRLRASDYSYPASLAARGLIGEAVEEYEAACRERPGHPDPMLHAAWTLRQHGCWEGAVTWYRRALDTPRIDARRAASAVRQLWEIQVTKLGDPDGAIRDLAAVVERYPDAEEAEWSRRELAELRREGGGSAAARLLLAAGFLAAALTAVTPVPASATWSVIAVDRETGRVVIASATCVEQRHLERFGGLRGVQAVVAPGLGIAAAQASVDWSGENQRFIHRLLREGVHPARILTRLREDPDIAGRQFGIVDLQGRFAGFSGHETLDASLGVQGHVPGTGIYYAVQGNILAADSVVHDAVDAFVAEDGSLTDRVMAAMEAADAAGGDRRCTCETESRPEGRPCHGRTAHVAYLLAADPGDTEGVSFNDGDYALHLDVTDGNLRTGEDANPVRALRARYEALPAERRADPPGRDRPRRHPGSSTRP